MPPGRAGGARFGPSESNQLSESRHGLRDMCAIRGKRAAMRQEGGRASGSRSARGRAERRGRPGPGGFVSAWERPRSGDTARPGTGSSGDDAFLALRKGFEPQA